MEAVVKVELGERSYRIFIGNEVLGEVGVRVRGVHEPCRCVTVTDENVAPLYARQVNESLAEAGFQPDEVVLPAGEEYKTLQTLEGLCSRFVEAGLDRSSLVVALGGGVVGDVAGFAAASYMRGIPYVQLPTTLLAQVDSSVGGKTGVNLPEGKNLVGAFHQPALVHIDVSTLDSLPARELKAGMVEVIKYGVIRDVGFFEWLEGNLDGLLALDRRCLVEAVRRCCEIKAEVVAEDEREAGLRAILNYGHTVGHAVENLTEYRELRHGEAVSMGMVVAAVLSCSLGKLAPAQAERHNRLLERLGTPTRLPALKADRIIDQMQRDKKAVGGATKFVLARVLGEVEICSDIPAASVREALLACGAID